MDGEIYVILGCFGRTDDGFVSCSGIKNPILVISPSNYFYNEIMDYLDNLQLFDRMMLDTNAIRHFIFNLQDRYSGVTGKLWSEKMFHLYQKFILDHKNCGLFIKLALPE
mgnify:CR=1 FL=1